jgi:hypothetical protein
MRSAARLAAAVGGVLVGVAMAGMPSAAADVYDPDGGGGDGHGSYSEGSPSPGSSGDLIEVPDGTAASVPWEQGGDGPDYPSYSGSSDFG